MPFFKRELTVVFRRELTKLTRINKFFIRKFRNSEILKIFTNENSEGENMFRESLQELICESRSGLTNENVKNQLRPQLWQGKSVILCPYVRCFDNDYILTH